MKSSSRRGRSYRPRYKSRRSKYSRRARVPKNFKRYVKKTIAGNIENKRYIVYGNNGTITGPTASVPPTFNLFCLPQVNQGTAQGQRIGDKIRIKRCRVSYQISQAPYDPTTNKDSECLITVLILKAKNTNAGVVPSQNWDNLFEVGTGTVSWQGTAMDTLFEINENLWTVVYKKVHLIGTYKGNDFTGISSYRLPGNESNYVVRRSFALPLKHIKKLQCYNDNVSSIPQTDNLWMYAYASPLEANGSYTASNTPARISYHMNWTYEDA